MTRYKLPDTGEGVVQHGAPALAGALRAALVVRQERARVVRHAPPAHRASRFFFVLVFYYDHRAKSHSHGKLLLTPSARALVQAASLTGKRLGLSCIL